MARDDLLSGAEARGDGSFGPSSEPGPSTVLPIELVKLRVGPKAALAASELACAARMPALAARIAGCDDTASVIAPSRLEGISVPSR